MTGSKNPRILLLVLVLFILVSSIKADVPNTINYQGRLTDDTGQPIDGTESIKFKIYGSESGNDSLWSSNLQAVEVSEGLFNYELGSNVPLPNDLFSGNDARYLGITVDSDPEISPRTQLVSVPYSLHAGKADPSTPIMWSGGCTSHGISAGWNKYCTNGVDFSNVAGYLSVSTNGTFTVLTSGYYRINTWAANFCTSSRNVKILKNTSIIHNDFQTNTGDGWRTLSADLTWYFDAEDTFEVHYYNDGGGYAYHAWSSSGQISRLQVTYVGP